jgi:hypothetical protein
MILERLKLYMIAAALLAMAGCTNSQSLDRREHRHIDPHASDGLAQSRLAVPPAIKIEHEHLHHGLEAALASGGKTAAAAREVADVLLPHFAEEEAFAMPPLGLLEPLANKQPIDSLQRKQAIQMAERLRRDYAKMLKEHESVMAALRKLAAAAKEENQPEHAAFAEALMVHARPVSQPPTGRSLEAGSTAAFCLRHETPC